MAMSMRSRKIIFLFSSFLSTVGDMLLVFAVPAGLGLETNDIRSAVLMWLIPAVAMFLSSFLNKKIEGRPHSVRTDYGYLLVGIAVLELIISVLALKLKTPHQTLVLITGFVFLYAVAKEGIPRLLYLVAVYRFFVDQNGYTKMAGLSNGLNIFASFLGVAFAAFLISKGVWRVALIIDAVTFVVFGLAILLVGIDAPSGRTESPDAAKDSKNIEAVPLAGGLGTVAMVVPLLFGINALVWNYLPLLSQRFSVVGASTSILLISVLRLPGLLAGITLDKILKWLPLERLVRIVPTIYFSLSVVFIMWPHVITLALLIVAQGALSGIYWPSDFSIRNMMSHATQVQFNTIVLRRLAIFQFLACCAALWIYSPNHQFQSIYVVLTLAGLIALIFFVGAPKKLGATAANFALAIALLPFVNCTSSPKEKVIEMPSVSKNLELRSELTYAGMTIVNDTSAHLVTVAPDLTLKGQVLKKYDQQDGGKKYILELDPDYKSARGESITTEDIVFSFQYYLQNKSDLAGVYKSIFGAEECLADNCHIAGLKTDDLHRIVVTLKTADLQFIEKLASPWLIILKKGKPFLEKIGDCSVPYQTGRAVITNCDGQGVHLNFGKEHVLFTDHPAPGTVDVTSLITDNPGTANSPTLTTLAAFANPQSKKLNPVIRAKFMKAIRSHSTLLAEKLKLKWSPLLTPQWLAIQAPSDLIISEYHVSSGQCPQGPIKVLLDTSLPNLEVLKHGIAEAIRCPVEFSITNADTYFQKFATVDIGIAWFTPDFLDIYNIFQPFDCAGNSACYFNWHDKSLQNGIDSIRVASLSGIQDKERALDVERVIFKKGYAAPIAEMNWWIKNKKGTRPIHPAGLFQIKVEDFL